MMVFYCDLQKRILKQRGVDEGQILRNRKKFRPWRSFSEKEGKVIPEKISQKKKEPKGGKFNGTILRGMGGGGEKGLLGGE